MTVTPAKWLNRSRCQNTITSTQPTFLPWRLIKTIKMPFGMWTRLGPRKPSCVRCVPNPHTRRVNFEGKKGLAQDMSDGQYTQTNSAGAELVYGMYANWGKVFVHLYSVLSWYHLVLKRSGMARVNEGSHSFTCHPHVYPQAEWIVPAFTSQPQSITALWLVLISRPTEGRTWVGLGGLVKY